MDVRGIECWFDYYMVKAGKEVPFNYKLTDSSTVKQEETVQWTFNRRGQTEN